MRVRENAENIAVEESGTEIRDGEEAEGAERERGQNLRQGVGLRLR